jgi:hypothetical protein
MVSPANVKAADPRNYALTTGMRLFFRVEGSTADGDWKDLGDIEDVSFAQTIDRFIHQSVRRGLRAIDREIVTSRSMQINLVLHELNLTNLAYAFGSDESDIADTTIEIFDSKIEKNPEAGGTISLGDTDIVPDSVILTRVLEERVDELTYTNPADFTVDENTGIITISAGGALATADEAQMTEEVHIFWKKLVETQKFEAFSGAEIDGEARFMMINRDGPSWVWEMPNVQIQTNGDIAVGDGTDLIGLPIAMKIHADNTGKFFFKHLIKEDEL